MDAKACLDREFLEMRCRLIDLAASLDRIERANGSGVLAGDSRTAGIREALAVLARGGLDRTEQVQRIFSDPYQSDWRAQFGL
jgi:hypothetical protein